MSQKYQAIMMMNETWAVVYLPSNENISHHETKGEALAAIERYKAADNRRARARQ